MGSPTESTSERTEAQLRSILEGTGATGDEFFHSLVRHLAAALDMQYAFVGELSPTDPNRVRTRALWARKDFGENFEYGLPGTPCEGVVNKELCVYPDGVQELFPHDALLGEMGVQSYLGTPLLNPSGGLLGLLVVMDDRPMQEQQRARDLVTIFAARAGAELERLRTEDALLRSEERTQLILDSALDAVITMDARGVVTGWNAPAEGAFGWSAREAIGRDLSELIIPPTHREAHRRGLRHFLDTGEGPVLGKRVELSALRRDGNEFPVELAIATLQTGDSCEFSAFIRDITERVRVEEQRREFDAQLQKAQKAESLGILAGGVAHDFNNLLTGILSNAGTARRNLPAESPAQRYLAEVMQGSNAAAHLTGQLLAYAGRGRFQLRSLDLSAEVTAIETLLQVSVRGKGSLSLDLREQLPAIEADPVQVHQVLMNLVTNAAESDAAEVPIRVGTRAVELRAEDLHRLVPGSEAKPGPYVALEVTDAGSGMDAATRERIFEPFFTTKATGRGLGLAATLGIVHGHGGGISIDSKAAAGTTFRVFFPASDKPVQTIRNDRPGDLSGQGVILVVDDDEYVLQGVYFALEGFGYSAILADSGPKALEFMRIRGHEIDLVLLDLTMPGMDGEETLRALRESRPGIKVLLSSGYDEDRVTRQFRSLQIDGFLRKPYDPDQLAMAVKRILGGTEQDATPEIPELDSLRVSYAKRLPGRLAELAAALRAAKEAGASEADARHAHQLAHTLKGTAGSYGFTEVGSELESIEATLFSMLEGGPRGASEWAKLDRALSRARASLDA